MLERLLAIGDIHGEFDKLLDLYGKIDFDPKKDLLVFLGDYIDRGPKPLEVLDWLMALRYESNIVMLRGNHEQMMLDFYVDKAEQMEEWAWVAPECDYGKNWLDPKIGGDITERRFAERATRMTPEEFAGYKRDCLDFLGCLPLGHRLEIGDRTYFFSHAGIRPGVSLEEQDPVDLLMIREDFYGFSPATGRPNYLDSPMVVAGHTMVGGVRRLLGMKPELKPVIQDNMILVDTAAFKGGPLSCVDALSGRVWQSEA